MHVVIYLHFRLLALYYQQHTAEIILYKTADKYLKQVMNGRTSLPIKKWKDEAAQLTKDKDILYIKMYSLRDDIKNVESIQRSLEKVLQPETTRTPQRQVTYDR